MESSDSSTSDDPSSTSSDSQSTSSDTPSSSDSSAGNISSSSSSDSTASDSSSSSSDSTSSDSSSSSTDSTTGDSSSSEAGTSDSSSSDAADADTKGSSTSGSPFLAKVPIPTGINSGVTFLDQATMLSIFGTPGALSVDCSDVTNAKLRAQMTTADVGPFKVTGLTPFVTCLTNVFAAVKASNPDLYAVLSTAGLLCCRAVRGSTTNFSNHSWGTAIDMQIAGVLTPRGDTTITQGLVDLAPFMNAEKLFWGAGFTPTADAMHFEVSHELISAWQADGTITT